MNGLNSSRWAPAASRSQTQSRSPSRPAGLTNIAATTSHLLGGQGREEIPNLSLFQQQTQPPVLTPSQRKFQTRLQEFNRFVKLLRRLKWKSTILMFCHQRALEVHVREQAGHLDKVAMGEYITSSRDAETMFKIDFFEYYVLLERTLVYLLGSFGIVISSSSLDPNNFTLATSTFSNGATVSSTKQQPSILGDSRTFHGSSYHRFHANVLAALDQPSNPLHEVLGLGDIRSYLGIAKEFRNKWKDAEVVPQGGGVNGSVEEDITYGMRRRYEKVLSDLRLEEMLACFLEKLEVGRMLAESDMTATAATVGIILARAEDATAGEISASIANFNHGGVGGKRMSMELDINNGVNEVPWEAMPDAMEWD